MFLSLDGVDGVGKTTQMQRLIAWLEVLGHQVVTCRDPGSTPLGETLRDVLLHSGPDRPIGATAEMLLYMAARAQLVEEVIRPAIEAGSVVVSDRFLLANLVYQAHAGGLDREAVFEVGRVAVGRTMPDHVILLDMDPSAADERRGRPADRMESRGAAYRQKLREGFLTEAQRSPTTITLVDASQSADEVELAIRSAIEPLLK